MADKTFEGQSFESLQDALNTAVSNAQASLGGTSEIVDWTLTQVRGQFGGFVDRNQYVVTIEAESASGSLSDAGQFIVVALTASNGEKHQGCRVLPEGALYPAIYSQFFGPASRAVCQQWIDANCGFDNGDPANNS